MTSNETLEEADKFIAQVSKEELQDLFKVINNKKLYTYMAVYFQTDIDIVRNKMHDALIRATWPTEK